MKKYLLPKEGHFYKANLHMHTVVSDGQFTPEEVKRDYMAHGYSIVAFTDHEIMVPHRDLEDENFLPILSYEFSINKWHKEGGFQFTPCYHLNLFAKDPEQKHMPVFVEQRIPEKSRHYITPEMRENQDDNFAYSVKYVNGLVEKANDMGFLVAYNHPCWSLQNYTDYAGLKGLWGVEFMNTGCCVEGYDDYSFRPIEDMLRTGQRVVPLGTDDAHHPPHCFGGFNMIKANSLSYGDVLYAMERGDLYASNGPLIDELYFEDGTVHIKCSQAKQISLQTERRFIKVKNAEEGSTVDCADFDISKYLQQTEEVKSNPWEPYFRITVKDEKGDLAFSRAYFIDELK